MLYPVVIVDGRHFKDTFSQSSQSSRINGRTKQAESPKHRRKPRHTAQYKVKDSTGVVTTTQTTSNTQKGNANDRNASGIM